MYAQHTFALFFFFFNDTATTEIYTLSLHDALPISDHAGARAPPGAALRGESASGGRAVRDRRAGDPRSGAAPRQRAVVQDRKSTRLNSSHGYISYAVFCLKKKNRISVSE